jgi:hypothetical protein
VKKPLHSPRDVVANARRVFNEFIERSEKLQNLRSLEKVATPPAKKNGATDYVESFAGVPRDFERPPQGEVETRPKIG